MKSTFFRGIILWFVSLSVLAGEAGVIIDANDMAPVKPAAVQTPQHITVQAAPPNVTVQAAQAPNVTVQAPPAPQVTVQAAQAPNVTVQAPPPANVHVDAPNINVPPAKTDWNALLTILAGAIGTIVAAVKWLASVIRKHRNDGIAEWDWQNLLAYAYQFAQGDGPARLKNAFNIALKRYQETEGEPMSATDQKHAENGLAALHLEAVGPLKHDASEELSKEETALREKLDALQKRKASIAGAAAVAMISIVLLCLPGCTSSKAASDLNEKIKSSNAASQASYKNITDALVTFYVNEQDALEDQRYQAAISSITKTVALSDGTKLQTANPNELAALARQHERNRTQIQTVADNMRAKIIASGADANNVAQLSGALKDYFSTQSNVSVNISQSATDVMALVQQFILAKPAATQLAPGTKPANTK